MNKIVMTCKIVARIFVSDEISNDKDELEICYERLRRLISNKIKAINNEDLNNLPIEITPFF